MLGVDNKSTPWYTKYVVRKQQTDKRRELIIMGTNNFYPHDNGIFVIEGMDEETAFNCIKDMRIGEENEYEEITDEEVYNEMEFNDMVNLQEFMSWLGDDMPHGMELVNQEQYSAQVVNKGGKKIANLEIRSGYYSDTQVIVETDMYEVLEESYYDNDTQMLEDYSPHHQRLLKFIASRTTAINKVAQFSNGEAIYERA